MAFLILKNMHWKVETRGMTSPDFTLFEFDSVSSLQKENIGSRCLLSGRFDFLCESTNKHELPAIFGIIYTPTMLLQTCNYWLVVRSDTARAEPDK